MDNPSSKNPLLIYFYEKHLNISPEARHKRIVIAVNYLLLESWREVFNFVSVDHRPHGMYFVFNFGFREEDLWFIVVVKL